MKKQYIDLYKLMKCSKLSAKTGSLDVRKTQSTWITFTRSKYGLISFWTYGNERGTMVNTNTRSILPVHPLVCFK